MTNKQKARNAKLRKQFGRKPESAGRGIERLRRGKIVATRDPHGSIVVQGDIPWEVSLLSDSPMTHEGPHLVAVYRDGHARGITPKKLRKIVQDLVVYAKALQTMASAVDQKE